MESSTPTEVGVRAGRREWVGLAVLALPTMLLALDNSVLFLAAPHLGADLAPSSTQLLWIMDIYGFMIAGFLVTMGTLGDRIGRRRLLLIGATAFGVASILAAYSASAEMLIAARALLGIAGATLMPSTLALIRNMFKDPKQRGTAIGVWMSSFLAGGTFGVVIGGLLLEFFWWGSVFLMGAPVMVLLLATAPALLPEYRDTGAGRPDLTSVILSLAAILPVIYGLKELAADGFGTLPVLAIVVGVAFAAGFVRRQRRLPDPLLDLRLFGRRSFRAALGLLLVGTAVIVGSLLFVAQYLQLVEGLSPLRAGLLLVIPTVGLVVGTMLAPQLAQRIRPATVIAAGLAIAAVGFLLLTQVGSDDALLLLMVGYSVASLGVSPLAVLSTDLVVGSAPPEKAGSAAAMSETAGEFGVAMGVATLGSVGTAVYRSQIADNLPEGVPAEAAEATRDTLAGAVTAAEHLPAGLAADLLAAAQAAFTSGMNVIFGVSAAAVVAVAVMVVIQLRHVRPAADSASAEEAQEVE